MGGDSSDWWAQIEHGVYSYTRSVIEGEFSIEDLAWQLAWEIRYNAATRKPWVWSVAAHACLVTEIIASLPGYATNAPLQLYGLHHDDHEVFYGDMITPLKRHLGSAGAMFEYECARGQRAIERKVHIHSLIASDETSRRIVKAADWAAFEAERRHLFVRPADYGKDHVVDPDMLAAGERIIKNTFPMPATAYGPAAAERFISRHNTIMGRLVLT